MTNWFNAENRCREMSNGIDQTTRLLDLNDINEFYFIQKFIKQILPDDQMNSSSHILSSVTAFVGSQGQRISRESKHVLSITVRKIMKRLSSFRLDLYLEQQ
jgi:hypothetical protein